ncbi:hypothetical protein CYQ88_08730 [Hydrogenovibrio sp. SC-1]|uniref:hypothetical protein n=1 Tax=Hydrogenovibrio sp. SC-1 TaxID=2065820 RepID=UPI000C7B45BC|nr:hypothetical protein [Hydrogenovibrio sp. SC-1]PLA73912.1 hypothetical protein CYQ88_08730 [Hydrogenovibrio sp. SC-1]
MPSLALTKITLLSESKNLLTAIESESWQEYVALNSMFQQHLSEAIEEYKHALDDTLKELARDNDQIQELVKCKQQSLLEESKADFKRLKQLKAYVTPAE